MNSSEANGTTGETKPQQEGRILIVTAVEAEREAVLRGLGHSTRFEVMAAGVGPAIAAANTATKLALSSVPYRLVISAGIGGGFPGQAELGDIVVSTRIIAADLGAQTQEEGGFLSVDELGFGSSQVAVEPAVVSRVKEALLAAGMQAVGGAALTVSTATGTAERAAQLIKHNPDAASEGMEGHGAAVAAQLAGIPAMELRAISNAVGPRDRAAWRIGDALQSLTRAFEILTEVL
ncbi:futalosine nucleosidase [Paenibacillus curdlanolyticus YK9]|uniref:Futalosine hydrolase n=1 Tax=Paenibacillus curdlanolyticus YK9 TaxID=717606 RepID=E0I6N9_9BACL|nr:futalosine hydrolase [Paenibacillus curdlanolyticus]EFM11705.1 futalosine nucleosidase [Paenibacillus curdlanolyticus YK9]